MPVLFLFFLSGFASLVLETVLRRELTLLLGSAVTATAVTLATFLGGLSLGAWLIGRRADRSPRPLALYGRLELGVAATAAASLAAMVYGRGALAGAAGAGPLLAAALLLPPTILMGGTLPALVRHRTAAGGDLVAPLAGLYAVNTLGAALGAGLAGFVFFEALGISATGWLAVALALLAGCGALALDRGSAPLPPPKPAAATGDGRGSPIALACAALGGAAALGYEVVWTRLLALPLRSYGYSFSLMLALFLAGIVLGSWLLGRIGGRMVDPLTALAIVQLASGAYVAASVFWLPRVLLSAPEGHGFGAFVTSAIAHASPVVLPPTILSGMALPLAVRVFGGKGGAARATGAVYAVNTAGSIAGALGAGLLLLPALGAARSLALLAALGAAAGALAALARRGSAASRVAAVALAAACGASVLVSEVPFREAFSRAGSTPAKETLFFREGATDTVAVVRRDYGFHDPTAKSVIVNGIAMTATVKPVWRYMAAEGHLPALLAEDPARALVICVGTGITLEAIVSHDAVRDVDAVDLSESVLAALPVLREENRGAFADAKVRLIHADGRHHLETTRERYGLISVEPPPPIVAGSVHLYTLDFYRLCRAHLEPGGVVAQWLPLHAQSLASAKATARTFLEAFPHAQLWLPSIRDAVLVGSDRAIALEPARLAAAYGAARTRSSLEAAYFETPQALLGTYLLDRDGIARWAGGADVVTDDRPMMEFFRKYGSVMSDREIATLLAEPEGPLDAVLGDGFDPALREAALAERRAHRLYLRSEVDDDARLSREAAVAARGTRFGLYRFGCDAPQLDALRAEPGDAARLGKQLAACERLFGAPR